MRLERLLFASCHAYLDPTSGAARTTRDLLELLAAEGADCRAIGAGVLDYERHATLAAALDDQGMAYGRAAAALSTGGAVGVLDAEVDGVRVTLLPTASGRLDRAPDPAEATAYLDLAAQAINRFRPQVLLSYGGHPADQELRRIARARGVAVAFHLHNFAYDDRRAFESSDLVLVPSEYSRRFHARRLGLESVAIPPPIRPDRVLAGDREPRYLTFVNPQPAKGAAVVARIALELGMRRPEIPILVVEGRGVADGLAGWGLDLSGLGNLHRMAVTPDPRDFYRVSRAVLVPSTWRESFGRVAAEALLNGLPVLASDRGALPETLGEAGVCLALPPRCTPAGGVPSAREARPFLAAIERLWDDPELAADQRRRALAEAPRWDAERVIGRYQEAFGDLCKKATRL